MSKKSILMLGAGAEQQIAISKAQEMGLNVIACDENPAAPGMATADVGIAVDIRDVDALVEIGSKHRVAGVFCHAVEIPETVALVAKKLGLPGLEPSVARTATQKDLRIEALKKAGVPVADFRIANSAEEAVRAATALGFPAVLKPVDNAGARGVRAVRDAEETEIAYGEALRFSRTGKVQLEQFLTGPQISTESLVYNGQIHTFAFADRNYEEAALFAPYFIENGINFPSNLAAQTQKLVCALVEKTIRALGIDFGAAKGDILIAGGVPMIIEMAARTSGGWFSVGSIEIATGCDVLWPLIQMSVGDVADVSKLIPTRELACAQRYVIPRRGGILKRVSGLEKIPQMPGVKMFVPFFPAPGSRIEKATNHAQRFAQVICTGETIAQAVARCEAAIQAIELEVI